MATQRPSAAGSGHARLCPGGCPLSSGREGNAPPSGFLGRGFLLKYGVGFVRTMSLAGCWRGSRGRQLTPPCLATAPNPAERVAWWGADREPGRPAFPLWGPDPGSGREEAAGTAKSQTDTQCPRVQGGGAVRTRTIREPSSLHVHTAPPTSVTPASYAHWAARAHPL